MKEQGPRRKCGRCHARCKMLMSSCSPGDGRRCFKCPVCGHEWSEGKKPSAGYK